jgi:seryl-tRNA synthetase
MLTPAACYPLYPTARGRLPAGGRLVDLQSHIFRHEPSVDPARMQSFRQREFVRLGTSEQAQAHRDEWTEKGMSLFRRLGLQVELVLANDPFFGRGGQFMAAAQHEQQLKFEIVTAICSDEKKTAISSFNYHLDHFGKSFDIESAPSTPAHSSCVGFGLERITLALLKTHGLSHVDWPREVRAALAL